MLEPNNILQSTTNNNLDEKIIELPIKKKKGRKSKQTKLLEQEELERNKIPIKLFPTLNEKIFDVVEIDGVEYFLDTDFGILYNDEIKQIGIKKNNKYIMYCETDITKLNQQLETDNKEISQLIKLYSNK
jgi:hypothetical protein